VAGFCKGVHWIAELKVRKMLQEAENAVVWFFIFAEREERRLFTPSPKPSKRHEKEQRKKSTENPFCRLCMCFLFSLLFLFHCEAE